MKPVDSIPKPINNRSMAADLIVKFLGLGVRAAEVEPIDTKLKFSSLQAGINDTAYRRKFPVKATSRRIDDVIHVYIYRTDMEENNL